MNDDYWNNIDGPGQMLSKDEYYEWLKDSNIIGDFYNYHDFAGGFEHTFLIEKGGFEYRLVHFNGHGEGHDNLTYILHRNKRCLNQDGDGI